MADKTEPKKKKSQKRVDRQARKAEKRRQKELLEKHELEKKHMKPVKARLSKKSLPGFLAKNVDAIIQWLKDYQTLFVMSDDYGIQKFDRLPQERRNLLVQNYVDVVDFISTLEAIKIESEEKQNALSCDNANQLDEISSDIQQDLL